MTFLLISLKWLIFTLELNRYCQAQADKSFSSLGKKSLYSSNNSRVLLEGAPRWGGFVAPSCWLCLHLHAASKKPLIPFLWLHGSLRALFWCQIFPGLRTQCHGPLWSHWEGPGNGGTRSQCPWFVLPQALLVKQQWGSTGMRSTVSLLLSCIFPQLMIRILWPQSLEEETWKNVRLF